MACEGSILLITIMDMDSGQGIFGRCIYSHSVPSCELNSKLIRISVMDYLNEKKSAVISFIYTGNAK